jgi:hypothetical protein
MFVGTLNLRIMVEQRDRSELQVEQDSSGKWLEVGTGAEAAGMERRYIMNAAVQDFSGQRYVNVFNEQAALMLGHSADALHERKVLLLLH